MPGWEGYALQFGAPLIAGLLGGDGMTKEQRAAYKMQKAAADQMYRYSQGVPGSDPQEMAALAQNQAQLGEQQLGQQRQMQGALQLGQQGSGSLQDFMMNMSSQQTAQRMNLSSEHMFNALAQRKQSLLQAAGLAGQAAQTAQARQQNGMGQMLGQLGETMAYADAQKQARAARQKAQIQAAGNQNPAPTTPDAYASAKELDSRFNAAYAPGNLPGDTNSVGNQNRMASGTGSSGFQLPEYKTSFGANF